MSEKRHSKKNKFGSTKQKPLVECKAIQLGKWVMGHELNNNIFALLRTHIDSTVGIHKPDAAGKTRLRFFERGLSNGDKPSILSFGLEQFYPIEDIKRISRDEKHTNVIFVIVKPPSLVYEVLGFRCPTEYEARQFVDQFKKIKDKSGTGFHVDISDPADGHEANWTMKSSGVRMNDVTGGNPNQDQSNIQNVSVDKTTKTLHITTTGGAASSTAASSKFENEPVYAVVDKSKKTTTKTIVETSGEPAQQTETVQTSGGDQHVTTEVVKGIVNQPVDLVLSAPQTQQTTTVVKEERVIVPQTQTTVVKESEVVVPQTKTTVVKESHVIVPQVQQEAIIVAEGHVPVPQTQQQTTVVKESHVSVPQQQATIVKETHVEVPQQQKRTTVVKETHVTQGQKKESLTVPSHKSSKVIKESQVLKENPAVSQQTTKVVKETHTVPKQQTVVTGNKVIREVEYNEVARLNARIISLEQENRYLRELLKQHSINDKNLENFMTKEKVTNGPLIDSVVVVDGGHNSQQTMKYSGEGEAAVTVSDYRRNHMTRTDSDRSMGSFIKVRKQRGGAQYLDNYVSGSLRSSASGSLYASSVKGHNGYGSVYGNNYQHVHPNHIPVYVHRHHKHGDIITQTMASPNAGYLIAPHGTFNRSAKHGHLVVNRPIEKVYDQPVQVVDYADGITESLSDDEDVFEVESPTPVKIV